MSNGVKAIRIHRQDLNGVDSSRQIPNITSLYVQHSNGLYVYNVTSIQVDPNDSDAFYLTVKPQHNTVPTGSAVSAVIFNPYSITSFKNSDYNAIINNATDIKDSKVYYVVDNNGSQLTPANIDAINARSLPYADVQDTNYESLAYSNIRYNGSSDTSIAYNVADGVIQHRDTFIVDFAYGGGAYPELPEAGGMKLNSLISVRTQEDITQISPGQAGFSDALTQALPLTYQPKIKQYSTDSLNSVGATVLAHGFSVPSKASYYIASGSGTESGLAEWVTGNPTQIVFKSTDSSFASKVATNNSGYYTPSAVTSSFTEFIPIISASLSNGDRWFASLYYDLGEVAQGKLSPINDGYTVGTEAYGAYEIDTAVIPASNGVINLKNPVQISGQLGFGSSPALSGGIPAGLLLWKAVVSDEHMLFGNATLSGVGKGAMLGNNPTTVIEEEFEYLTKTYGSNPN